MSWWRLRLICCGRDDDEVWFSTWDDADEFRRSYIGAPGHKCPGCAGCDGNKSYLDAAPCNGTGHLRSAILEEAALPVGTSRPRPTPLDAITDRVLAYQPAPKSASARKRRRKARKKRRRKA